MSKDARVCTNLHFHYKYYSKWYKFICFVNKFLTYVHIFLNERTYILSIDIFMFIIYQNQFYCPISVYKEKHTTASTFAKNSSMLHILYNQ